MLRACFLVSLLISTAALAEARPPALEPVPAPPPVPADSALEPQVTITQRGEDKVEEYRLRGRLYMIKITPPHGRPYYLVDNRGDGHFAREEPLDSGLRVPTWVIKEF
ncbi:MAG: hypothetical protein RIR70_60 [Pseudomonadota bacterium]